MFVVSIVLVWFWRCDKWQTLQFQDFRAVMMVEFVFFFNKTTYFIVHKYCIAFLLQSVLSTEVSTKRFLSPDRYRVVLVKRKNKQSMQSSAERPVFYKTGCVYLQTLVPGYSKQSQRHTHTDRLGRCHVNRPVCRPKPKTKQLSCFIMPPVWI